MSVLAIKSSHGLRAVSLGRECTNVLKQYFSLYAPQLSLVTVASIGGDDEVKRGDDSCCGGGGGVDADGRM